jgi:hypothetical protein
LDDILSFTLKVASGASTLEECQQWFEQNAFNEYLSNP